MAPAIAVCASITSVNVLSNKLDMESANLLLKVKAEKPNLCTLCGLTHNETELDLKYNGLGPGDAKLLAAEILVMPSLTSVDLCGNILTGVTETGYVKASKVQGSSFNVGDEVTYNGQKMIVSEGKDSDGEIKMRTVADLSGITALADALRVSASLTSVR